MSSVQRFQLGPDAAPIRQGRSSHGRWRAAVQPAGQAPATPGAADVVLDVIQDADRLAFALAEGPAAALVAEHLTDRLWTRGSDGDDWPAPVLDWLTDGDTFASAPDGLTGFITGRLERNIAGGRIFLAWLGMTGVRLIDRTRSLVELDLAVLPDEGWTPGGGLQPPGAALHAHHGALYGLERLFVFSTGARPIGNDLPDLPQAELERALEDWAAESDRGLAIFDLRLNLLLIEPDRVAVRYRWTSPDTCALTWTPVEHATGYRVEESPTPAFDEIALLAELTDQRQVQYRLSPPVNSPRYYRVVPINRGVPGMPSEPMVITPLALSAPVLEPVRWASDGGYNLNWSPVVQATGYEVETAPSAVFEPHESAIVYRGEAAEAHLSPDTPPLSFFRVRAINVLYAPHAPSDWSRPQQAPAQLETPVFTEVSARKLAWAPVPGARHYAVHVTPRDQDEGQGEDYFTAETFCGVADQPATYRVRALRDRDDAHTASAWSEAVKIAPSGQGAHGVQERFLAPLMVGAALVALILGAALGAAGLSAYQDYRATDLPTLIPQARLDDTATAAARNAEHATAVVQLGAQNERLSGTLQAAVDAERTLAHIPTLTPSITPDLTEMLDTAFSAGLTATAARWTDTPTPSTTPPPTITPDITETFAAAFSAGLTATAARWTDTPTPSTTPPPTITPDSTETFAAAFSAGLTATAARWTDTPTPSTTPPPTITPDSTGTFAAGFSAGLTATAARWTDTPAPTVTPGWTPASVCVASARDDRIGIVRSAPGPGGVALARLADPLVVLGQRTVDGETWLRVWLDDQGLDGWILARSASVAPPGCLEDGAGRE